MLWASVGRSFPLASLFHSSSTTHLGVYNLHCTWRGLLIGSLIISHFSTCPPVCLQQQKLFCQGFWKPYPAHDFRPHLWKPPKRFSPLEDAWTRLHGRGPRPVMQAAMMSESEGEGRREGRFRTNYPLGATDCPLLGIVHRWLDLPCAHFWVRRFLSGAPFNCREN